jgi:phosphoribosylformimino-5-aminoimidazole carboxamide ribotide isomerase
MRVVPSIDLRGGRVVRLAQGDFSRETAFSTDPVAVALRFAEAGAARIHLVDLDGARSGHPEHSLQIEAVRAAVAPVGLQLGGGVRSVERAAAWLESGIERVVMGTVAVEHPEVLEQASTRFPGRVILGLDTREGRVALHGWERVGPAARDLLERFEALPLGGVLHTDVARDGLLEGPSVSETAALARLTQHPVTASGGVGTLDHLRTLARERVIAEVIVGRALYERAFTLEEALAAVEALGASC